VSNRSKGLSDELYAYMVHVGAREHPLLARLRDETAKLPQHDMQIAPEQGAFMAILVELMGARKTIELGTFTGYSSLAVALALPPEGRIVCCDISEEWTSIARRYWQEAGVADRVDLRLGPALETLDRLIKDGEEGTFDFAFVDADKTGYPDYHERLMQLIRPGGLVVYDNVFWGGDVADPSVQDPSVEAVRTLNERLRTDERVTVSMIPVADGLTLARKR
jgi:predicted O-methyltransferase YrrM